MSPPLLGAGEEEGQSNVSLLTSSASVDGVNPNGMAIMERNYLGLSDCSSVDSSSVSDTSDGNNDSCLSLKATELRLGLPGCQSPERDSELNFLSSVKLDEKPLFPVHPSTDGGHSVSQRVNASGTKRGFSDAMDGFPEGKFLSDCDGNGMMKSASAKDQASKVELMPRNAIQERPRATTESIPNRAAVASNNGGAPATKAQVVGWPPVKSFRKNTLASTPRNTEEVDGKAGSGALFVKVSMDGAPYLRKVDLKTYAAYQELASALEKMFSCFTMGRYGSHGTGGSKDKLSESKLKDLLNGSEYVLTYEDKDGDWMLVGDVPWEMFVDTCKKVRIMKSSDAIGLAPRAAEKCRSRY